MSIDGSTTHAPLTQFSDDEVAVPRRRRRLCERGSTPAHVPRWSATARSTRRSLRSFSRWASWASRSPRNTAAPAGSLFMVALGVEETQQGRSAAAAILDGRAEHARQLSHSHVRQRPHQVDVPAAAHGRQGRRVRALRARLGFRRVRHADARRAAAATGGSSTAARCGSPMAPRPRSTSCSPTPIPSAGLQGHHGVRRRTRLQGLQRRQEGGQARHSCVEHHRADSRRCRGARQKMCSAPWVRATRSPSRR